MLDQLLGLFRGATPAAEPTGAKRYELAAAALLVTAGGMDDHFDEAERARALELLATRFALTPEGARAMLAEAETLAKESVDLFAFTHAVKAGFPPEERIDVIEMLWEVVYADGTLNDFEANLMRRVAGLLGVSDFESGSAKLRVRERLGL